MARDKKHPNIDFHIHNKLPPFVDIEKCKEQLVKHLFRFKQEVKVFFIGYPRINSIVNTDIDLLLIVALENKDRNFLIIDNPTSRRNIYFNNLIIPIKFLDGYQENNITFPNFSEENHYAYNILVDDGIELAIGEEIDELKWKTKKYLEKIWKNSGLNSNFSVSPYPIIWILSPNHQHHNFRYSNVIYAPYFGFYEISEHLKYAYFNSKSFSSVYQWSTKENKNNKESYFLIDKQINSLIERIEKDNKIGSLTKSKIERLNKEYAEDNKIYEKYLSEQKTNNSDDNDDSVFDLVFGEHKKKKLTKLPERIRAYNGLKNNLVIISGKAGSGKTSEMLSLIKRCYEDKKGTYYITYNKMLVNDVKININAYQIPGRKTATRTLHKFFKDVAKRYTILFMMTRERKSELEKVQKIRFEKVKNVILNLKEDIIDFNKITSSEILMNFLSENNGDRNYYLRMIGCIRRKYNIKLQKSIFLDEIESYHNKNIKRISNSVEKEMFLKDYYQVLRNILAAINNSDELYSILGIAQLSNDEWIDMHIKIRNKREKESIVLPSYLTEMNRGDAFKKLISLSLSSLKGTGNVLFIDEAQDCHPLERDILLSIWKEKDIIICSGGKEQLIRHSTECNWRFNDVTRKPLHNIITIEKRSKTYRMKPNLVKLCNFIAEKFEIKLDLSAYKTDIEDSGNVIIEFGDDENYTKSKKIFDKFNENGKRNELTNYESILFLSESNSDILIGGYKEDNFYIDAENNILDNIENIKDKKTKLGKIFEIPEDDIFLHNQKHLNNEDLDTQDTEELDENSNEYIEEEQPTPDKYRSIFYESCRGLEAWSVMCFDLDSFYQRKYDEEVAASYLSDDLLLTETQRREKYAITWVLMALTRPIDSLYIHLNMKLLEKKHDYGKQIDLLDDIDSKLKLRNVLAEYAGYEIDESHKIKSLNSSVCFESDWEDIPF